MPDEESTAESRPDFSKPLQTDGKPIWSSVGAAIKDAATTNPFGKDGVFAQLAKTATGKNAYETDHFDLAHKNLLPEQVAKQFAMPDLEPGCAQTHISEDSVLHVDGNVFALFKKTRAETTIGKSAITHLDQRTTSIGVKEQHLVYGIQEVFVNGESSAQYTGKRETKAPEDFEWKQLDRAFAETKFDGALVATGITGTQFEFTGADFSLHGISPKEITVAELYEKLKKLFPEAEEAVEGGEGAVAEAAEGTAAVAAEGVAEGAEVAAVAAEGAEAVAVGAAAIVAAPEILVGAAVLGVVGLAAWGVTKAFGSSSSSSSSSEGGGE